MNIQPIVEGHGEVKAMPVLLRRLRDEAGAFGLDVNPPIRRNRSDFVKEDDLRRAVKLARLQENCAAILVLFDSDKDCPKEHAAKIQVWATSEAHPLPCFVVMAHREFEAWFLATIESIRGLRGIKPDATSHPDPESVRGAKEALEERMPATHSYQETADQAAFCARFDMAMAYRRCRSFRRLVRVFGLIVAGVGLATGDWPPAGWVEDDEVGG